MATAETQTNQGEAGATRLVEVYVPARWNRLGITILAGIGFVILMVGLAALLWAPDVESLAVLVGVTLTGSVAALGVIGMVLAPSWVRRKTRRLVYANGVSEIDKTVGTIAGETFWAGGFGFAAELAQALAGIRCTATVIRMRTSLVDPDPVAPLRVPFEPRLVDESDPSFRALAMATQDEEAAVAKGDSAWSAKLARDARRGRRRRIWFVVGQTANTAVVLVAVWAMLSGTPMGLGRTWLLVPVGVVLGALIAILTLGLQRRRMAGQSQWFVVPGGLVKRTTSLLDSAWILERLAARDCVLCTYPVADARRPGWVVVIASYADMWRLTVTAYELELLLRAWLSPLSPPGEEQLSDLL